MARYIDADELYKAAQKRIAEANEARMAVVDDEFLDLINDAFTEDVAPRAEWISVRERLPEQYGLFLIADDKGNMEVASWTKQFGWFSGGNRVKRVTHWMPLPDPPKGD